MKIDERYLDSPYYITPDGKVGQDAFAVIREAMRGKDMVALGRVVLSKRERVVMLAPWDKGLVATTLRYPYEVRDTKEYFEDIPDLTVEPEMLKLAQHILQSKTADFEPSRFVDRYEEAVLEMLKKKQAGIVVSREPAASRPQNVTNVMDALRRSLAQEVLYPLPQKKARKRVQGQGEMLLAYSKQEGHGGSVNSQCQLTLDQGSGGKRLYSGPRVDPKPRPKIPNDQLKPLHRHVMIENLRTHPYTREGLS